MSADELSRAVDLLVRQVAHWAAPRWAAPATVGNAARSDLLHRLVQQLANLAADAAGEPRRTVPRLANDLVLPDQLRVVAADLLAVDPPASVLSAAAAEVVATRNAL
jgi:regulator of protease activity HflC (stomatin/prohibitin superfamily)